MGRGLGTLGLVTLAACRPTPGAAPPHADAPAAAAWSYVAHVDDDGRGVAVRLCFEGAPPAALRTIAEEAAPHFEGLAVEGSNHRLAIDGRTVSLAAVPEGGCVRWHADFDAIADAGGRSATALGDSVLVRQSSWLLWPQGESRRGSASLELHLPTGVRASVPWPLLAGDRDGPTARYALDATVSRWMGYTAFGQLAIERFERAGAEIEIVRLDAAVACGDDGVRAWIDDAIDGAAMLYRGYPRDRLQVVVVPVDGGGGTVYFGAAARGGGAGVYLLLDTRAPAQRLPGGWTTVHELLHHGMPFVADAWMGEGFVSYYTEVMRSRQGHRDEREGWQELYEAFERGRRDAQGRGLAQLSDAMHETHAYQAVYWGGAAIAFELDVALRLADPQGDGFDAAMRELRRCCGDAVVQVKAETLLQQLDRWYGKPWFTRTARDHLDARGFADTDAVFARLGITIVDGRVVLDDAHPAAAARRAIMAPRGD
ncbi:MAG: hypothetical protein K1X88_14105 [Nannocystaceae bacterium]|nr:hypothetical protein [Nannocystaceae bacterium]